MVRSRGTIENIEKQKMISYESVVDIHFLLIMLEFVSLTDLFDPSLHSWLFYSAPLPKKESSFVAGTWSRLEVY